MDPGERNQLPMQQGMKGTRLPQYVVETNALQLRIWANLMSQKDSRMAAGILVICVTNIGKSTNAKNVPHKREDNFLVKKKSIYKFNKYLRTLRYQYKFSVNDTYGI